MEQTSADGSVSVYSSDRSFNWTDEGVNGDETEGPEGREIEYSTAGLVMSQTSRRGQTELLSKSIVLRSTGVLE